MTNNLDETEVRKEVPWYEWYYDVSNLWRVRSYFCNSEKRFIEEPVRILSPWSKQWKRLCITLFKDVDRKYHFSLNRLVASAFLWLDYSNKKIRVQHVTKNQLDNTVGNLILCPVKCNTARTTNSKKNTENLQSNQNSSLSQDM